MTAVRGAQLREGDVVVVDGRVVRVAAIRPAMHRPDVTRVLTGVDGREVVVNVRRKYEVRS